LKIEKAIESSELLLVEGGKKRGKLTFALFSSCMLTDEESEIVLFSPFPKALMRKRLDIISDFADDELSGCIERMQLLCLKENYRELKALYGFEFIIDDIERAIERVSANVVIFHRLDAMFELQESSDAEWFIESIVALKRKKGFKLFITAGSSGGEHSYLHEMLENYMDMQLLILRDEYGRKVEVTSSIYPVREADYYLKKTEHGLELSILSDKMNYMGVQKSASSQKEFSGKKRKDILLISDDSRFVSLNRYLLQRDRFRFHAANTPISVTSAIMKGPELIILDSADENEAAEVDAIIKKYAFESRLICVVEREYIRSTDKLDAMNNGCYDIFRKNTLIEEYVMGLERALDIKFYSPLIGKLPRYRECTGGRDELCTLLTELFDKGVYFTLMEAISSIDMDKLKSRIRDRDIICSIDGSLFIVFVNSRRETVEKIVENKFTDGGSFEVLEILDVLDKERIMNRLCEK
jgi:hypothetical protein